MDFVLSRRTNMAMPASDDGWDTKLSHLEIQKGLPGHGEPEDEGRIEEGALPFTLPTPPRFPPSMPALPSPAPVPEKNPTQL